jgi:hypothetical protein
MTSSALIAEPKGRYSANVPSEAALWDLWEASVRQGLGAPFRAGELTRVVSSGRRGKGPGPDFCDAVLKTRDGRLLIGDVEVHRQPGGWKEHAHNPDPRYNKVVLHVVFRGAGEARFQSKAARFRLRLAYVMPEEVLYAGLMEALGYSANREPFGQLALSLPYAWLRTRALGLPGRDRQRWLDEALLNASGLGGSGVNGSGVRPLLQATDWRVGGLRPANHPRRRPLGAAQLLHRWLPMGLEAGLEPTVRVGDGKGLIDALVVEASGGLALVGRSRALDIAANVVLPHFRAVALRRKDRTLAQEAIEAFKVLPSAAENEITREFRTRALVAGGSIKATARIQQGMLHIYRHGCRWLACEACPLRHGARDVQSNSNH